LGWFRGCGLYRDQRHRVSSRSHSTACGPPVSSEDAAGAGSDSPGPLRGVSRAAPKGLPSAAVCANSLSLQLRILSLHPHSQDALVLPAAQGTGPPHLESSLEGTPAESVLNSSTYRCGSCPYDWLASPYCAASSCAMPRISRGMAARLCLLRRRGGSQIHGAGTAGTADTAGSQVQAARCRGPLAVGRCFCCASEKAKLRSCAAEARRVQDRASPAPSAAA
jgi:hypothetical protein